MWEMMDEEFDCDPMVCGGIGPPPEFLIPPPPRPPFLSIDIIKCTEDTISLESIDKCEAIPVS